jgi:hypothetical protein
VSDWRVCELERIGAVILDAGATPADPVEATCGPWRVLWSWDGVSVARVEGFDRWAVSRVARFDAATGDDVSAQFAGMLEAMRWR